MNEAGKGPATRNLQSTQTRPPIKPPTNTWFKIPRPEQAQELVAVTFLKTGKLDAEEGRVHRDAEALHQGPALWRRER